MILPGTIVKCVYNDHYPLTIGKEYKVQKENKKGTFEGVIVVNDNGKKAKYKLKYFQITKKISVDDYLDATDF